MEGEQAESSAGGIKIDTKVKVDAKVNIKTGGVKAREMSAPLRDVAEGHLDWESGAAHLVLRAGRNLGSYRARFEIDIPDVRVQEGQVAVQYRQRTLFGRAGGKASLE